MRANAPRKGKKWKGENMPRNLFKVAHYSHTMGEWSQEAETREDARRMMAKTIRRLRRKGEIVSVNISGLWYEVTDPDDATMVSEDAGTLRIVAPIDYRCFSCGCDFTPETVPTFPRYAECGCAYGYPDDECAPDAGDDE